MTTIIFPGQGSQYVGMSRDFYDNFDTARKTFQFVEDISNIKIKNIVFENNSGLLDVTQFTQLAIFTASISIFKVLKNEVNLNNLNINFMLGHSLGEYCALVASDIISLEDCIKLLKLRGEIMHNAYLPNHSGMAAIIGIDSNLVQKIISENNLLIEIANDNSPIQVVISGIKDSLIKSEKIFINSGAKRFILLNVSAAFHSNIMKKAENEFKIFFQKIIFQKPANYIISNYSAKSSNDQYIIKDNLIKQMSNRVRWVESINHLVKFKEKNIIEIGPGRVLSGLIKRISNNFTFYNIEKVLDLKKIINEF